MIILVIFCNPISDLEFFFHLSQQSVGLLEVYTLRKAATFNLIWVTNADFKLDSFAFTGATGTGVNFNSSNFMVVHCLPCYRIYIVFYCLHMLQNLPAEINSIYLHQSIVAVLLGLIFLEHLQW
jgi:hypothetical protein